MISLTAAQPPLVFADIFGNHHPVHVEIGCGKGRFLVTLAEQYPDINFFGIDRLMKWMKIGLQKKDKRKIGNLRLIKMEARELVSPLLAPDSVDAFHINFPDPWPKRRHRKRRLVTADFLGLLQTRLKDGGRVEIATDDLDYFEHMKQAGEHTVSLWRAVRKSINQRLCFAGFRTNYEIKYEAAGKQLYYLELWK